MKLPFSLPFGKKEQKNYFLALLLEDENVHAVLFEETVGKIHIAAHAEESLPLLLEEATTEQLLDVLDKAITATETSISSTLQTEKTIFGVKNSWIEEGKIKKEYLVKLKTVCDELALQPIGFLVFTEAITHLLQQEEGAPVSAILVETGKTHASISLVRAGRIIENHQVPLGDSLPTTVDTALKQFVNTEILPARIIFFDSENNEKVSQSFISHTWSRSLPFLHVPQVTILPPHFDTKAILYGTAAQMGFDVLSEHMPESLKGTSQPAPVTKEKELAFDNIVVPKESEEHLALDEDDQTLARKIEEEIEHPVPTPLPTEEPTIVAETVSSEYFGFITNKDIAHTPHKVILKKEIEKQPTEEVAAEIAEIPEEVKEETTHAFTPESLPTESKLVFEGTAAGISNAVSTLPWKNFLTRIKQLLPSPKRHPQQVAPTHTPPTPRGDSKGMPPLVFIIPVVAILGIIGLIVLYLMMLKATITVGVKPEVIQDDQSVTFVQGATTDASKGTIGTTLVTTDESGNVSADATGTKNVGTAAKGQITIFSRLTSTTVLAKGTGIVSSTGLKFTLDNAVTIASFSGGPDDPSTTVSNVALTASDIGKDANLPSGTKFTIAGQSKTDVSAKNDTAFSGGTSSTVTVVSQKDIDGLVDQLTKNLESKAKDDIQKKIASDQTLLPDFIKEELTKKSVSKSVGDEAKSVSLDGTITYTSAAYAKQDITTLSNKLLANKIPQGANLADTGIDEQITDMAQKDAKTTTATLHSKALLIPTIDIAQLKKEVAGKSFTDVATILKQINQVTDTTIVLQPTLPFLPRVLPRLSQNISIQIVTNE